MTTFFTGTTLECLHQILEDGYISVDPPKRVWDDFSANYVYLVPSEVLTEDGEDAESREGLMGYALEQATFALGKLKGSMRVVIEVENIDESILEIDPDGKGIYAVRYPKDILVSNIKAIHLVKGEHREMNDVRRLAASYWFTRSDWDSRKVDDLAIESGWYEDIEGSESWVFSQIDVPFIETLDIAILVDSHEYFALSENLWEKCIYDAEWMTYSVKKYTEEYLPKKYLLSS